MEWYYVEAGKQAGPVSEADFEQLIASGRIPPDALVGQEGMPNSQPLRQVRPGAGVPSLPPAATSAGSAPPIAGSAPTASTAGTDVGCAQCGGIFPRENTIQYGTSYVCAACKPTFLQRIKEGVPTAFDSLNYAGFWIRFCAKFIDGLVFMVVAIPFFILMFSTAMRPSAGQTTNVVGLALNFGGQLVFSLFSIAYSTFFHGKWGATLGKMAVGIKVVTPEGSPISFARAFGRAMAEILSGLPSGVTTRSEED